MMSDIQREVDENCRAFEKMVPRLKALRGKHFLMRHGKIINFYDTYNDAYSTGAAVYDDKDFSVCFLKGPKTTRKKEPVRKAASKKSGKSGQRSRVGPQSMDTLSAARRPRKTDVPGYDRSLPDQSPTHFEIVAEQLHIWPFYRGPGYLPFECLKAGPEWTTIYSDGGRRARTGWFNAFHLKQECIWRLIR
jgi:hypothetical protein